MEGNDVVILQELVSRSPYVSPVDMTGEYDAQTGSAVQKFQEGTSMHAALFPSLKARLDSSPLTWRVTSQ